MGKIYCIIGKSSSGKDTIYKKLIQDKDLNLHHIVPYTTRPIREGEKEGIEYHFTDEATLQKYRDHNKLVECRAYQTIYGIWYYYTVKDDQIDLSKYSYLVPGVLQSYCMTRDYFGTDKVLPIYVEVEDGERLTRARAFLNTRKCVGDFLQTVRISQKKNWKRQELAEHFIIMN